MSASETEPDRESSARRRDAAHFVGATVGMAGLSTVVAGATLVASADLELGSILIGAGVVLLVIGLAALWRANAPRRHTTGTVEVRADE